ncbi:carbonic anhydrase [Tumebacillus permanentifrigoris]|uniref:carbonic anhydrase n=1 Tax=Tumebacillus permanentifrigoris TaxID=378543 RepID=A0A316D594_9BACL|nr:carbonic anhydrase [Tumebacillus permanentifrigoris]PWK08369.1 carbonic anhydrase [Tumebacillus permanentifrigoris]
MKKALLSTLVLPLLLAVCTPQALANGHNPPPSADSSLQTLLEGNKRFVVGNLLHPHQTPAHRTGLAKGQHPIATILSCSDSRVPPEVVFDQGLGDLFVTRVAGNVLSDEVLGSIEYGAEHLEIPLIVVLGHERCGAVTAVVQGEHASGSIKSLFKHIQPAVQKAKQSHPPDLVEASVRTNVRMVVHQIETSKPLLAQKIHAGKVHVVGARYDLDTGEIELLR